MTTKVTKLTTAKAGALIIDLGLYPRQKIDRQHVTRLRDALRAGAELPPLHVDKKTKIVVDGIHRLEAMIKEFGAAHKVSVVWHNYKAKSEMFRDSVSLNATHGLKFSKYDRGRILVEADAFGLDMDEVCRLLQITPYTAEKILGNVRWMVDRSKVVVDNAVAKAKRRGKQPEQEKHERRKQVCIKRGLNKLLRQETITKEQAAVNDRALGVPPMKLATDLLDRIEQNCILYSLDFVFVLERLKTAIDVALRSDAVKEVKKHAA